MENVFETMNYDKFKFETWNRDIKEKNLKKIDKSVKEVGWKKHPIIVNENMVVIDGQHRLFYAKMHNLPVYYVIIHGLEAKDCVDMNNIRTAWNVEDYIKLYASQGIESYILLRGILGDYTFAPTSTIISLLKGNAIGGQLSAKIRNGEFKLTQKECKDIRAKFDFLKELQPYIKAVKGRSTSIYSAIAFCYDLECVNNARLKKQVKNRIGTITPPIDIEAAYKEIEWVYNYKIKQEDYAYILTEYKKAAREKQLETAYHMHEENLRKYGNKSGRPIKR